VPSSRPRHRQNPARPESQRPQQPSARTLAELTQRLRLERRCYKGGLLVNEPPRAAHPGRQPTPAGSGLARWPFPGGCRGPRSGLRRRLRRPVACPPFSTPRLRGLLHPAALSVVFLTERLPAEHAALPVRGTAPGERGGTSVASPTRPGSGRRLPSLPPWRAASSARGTWGRRGRRPRRCAPAAPPRGGRRGALRPGGPWPSAGVSEGANGTRTLLHGLAGASTPE